MPATDTDPAPDSTGTIVGRDRDLAVLSTFVERLSTCGSALLLTGDPGIGKSTILDAAVGMARTSGIHVVRVTGTEFAADASFSALDHLLSRHHAEFARLSPNHRQELTAALGLSDGPTPQGLVLANAVLELLRKSTSAPAALVVVDDLQWLDPASAQVLAVMARRLSSTTVGLLGASRPNVPAVFATAALPEHHLAPLAGGPAEVLVRSRHPGITGSMLKRVLDEALGNPLALIELPGALSAARLALGSDPSPLPMTQRLSAMFTSRLDGLPTSSREVLLLVALAGTDELSTISRASRSFGGLDRLAPAESAGIVTLDIKSRMLAFRHPVARSTVVDRSTDIERRRAHRALADALADQPEKRAWHLASACADVDEEVATLLESVGHASVGRGDAWGATAALTRAAELSETRTERGRRFIDAAYISAAVTGQLHDAESLLAAAHDADPGATASLRATVTVANLILNSSCDVEAAQQLLIGALRRHAPDVTSDDETLSDALYSLFSICWHAGRPELWEQFGSLMQRDAHKPPTLVRLSESMAGDPAHQARSWLGALDTACFELRREIDPVRITRTAIASIYVDRVGTCRKALWQVIDAARESRTAAIAASAMLPMCLDDWLIGQWDEALELAQEGLDLSERHGCRRLTEILRGYVRPLIHAARGEWCAPSDVEQMEMWARQQGIGMATTLAHHVRTLAAASGGDFETAYQHATSISPAGVLAHYSPHALWVLLDLVESAVRTGRTEQASAHVNAMSEADVGTISPRLALVVAGAAAIAASGDEATLLYQKSLAVPGRERWPFDLARIELCFGEHLRRQQDLVESRAHLMTAADVFERLGAKPWVTRAHEALRATGLAGTAPKRPGVPLLTPEELEIAQLAAVGLSNKQIAERLYVSHRTVGAHLYRMFPKLGITTRAGLRDALDALG